ncbi:uncharacterized protein J8A68_003308 [[Candida] subhashii]|uniref:RNA polymerase II-associated protein 1 n=1 Tax=[Candida] subhashii TaxID=561895 RepID=A0A8J5QVS8_9ASCO|nr:uncharacterized protein J8A68_003308 [[Candida] subhashii]KAG7663130.1 hypothetical protein J8A68_003308 [[Candida] subhashii]
MSQKPQKPIRQDYIAKVRYTNNLPPPPLNPKFIEYNTTEQTSSKIEAEQLLASLFRKENFQGLMERIDDELGLNLNLINNNGFLDQGNDSVICNLQKDKDRPITLHPRDRALLRDAGIGKISKSEPGVSFLRRTEYISERERPQSRLAATSEESKLDAKTKAKTAGEGKHDAESQLAAVEHTFDVAQESLNDLNSIKHPRKKHLKAVDAWPLLPDTSMMDNKFLTIRFLGSASLSRDLETLKRQQKDAFNAKFHQDSIASTVFKPISSADGEWISMFQVKDAKRAAELKSKLNSTERERPVNLLDEEEDNLDEYNFKYVKNYDMNFQRFNKPNEELAIKFIPEEGNKVGEKRKAALYYPTTGRIDLKKHRASTNSEINRFLRDSTLGGINFRLREPTTNELKKMDNIRSEFDPMEYEGEDEEDDEEEEEEEDEHEDNADESKSLDEFNDDEEED